MTSIASHFRLILILNVSILPKKTVFFENWDNFVLKIIPLMIIGIKDGNSKVILKNLLEVDNTDIGKYRLKISCYNNIDII